MTHRSPPDPRRGLQQGVEAASGWAQVSTLIGYGSPNKAGSHDVHGAALGAKETEATREKLQWKYGEFEIPEQAYKLFGRAKEAGSKAEQAWEQSLADYGKKYPEVSGRPLSQPAWFSSHWLRDVTHTSSVKLACSLVTAA